MPNIEKLFYSPKEKLAFWVAGWRIDSVTDIIVSLQKDLETFTTYTQVAKDTIRILNVGESRRYLNMRVLYAETEKAPDGAWVIENDSTMQSWLER